ncbi:MAG: glycosyltransferase family 4 protein [Nanoarchaeota archaeon]
MKSPVPAQENTEIAMTKVPKDYPKPSVALLTHYSEGGVGTQVAHTVRTLSQKGFSCRIVRYMPYRLDSSLSVPSWKPGLRPAMRVHRGCIGECPVTFHDIGILLPELESARHLCWKHFRDTVASSQYHIVVSGNPLPGYIAARLQLPCMGWVASEFDDDRKDRRIRFPWYRRLVENCFDAPLCRYEQRIALDHMHTAAVSQYTRKRLLRIMKRRPSAMPPSIGYIPIPIDTEFFTPPSGKRIPGRIGFAGRYKDPRKNLPLLLRAFRLAMSRSESPLTLEIMGVGDPYEFLPYARRMGISDSVIFTPYGSREKLRDFYRRISLLAIPSVQEGLGIVGLEAMSCTTPVVSTRCGGPEDFIRQGHNGILCDFSTKEFADGLLKLISQPWRSDDLGRNGRKYVCHNHNAEAMQESFWKHFNMTFKTHL